MTYVPPPVPAFSETDEATATREMLAFAVVVEKEMVRTLSKADAQERKAWAAEVEEGMILHPKASPFLPLMLAESVDPAGMDAWMEANARRP